MLISAPTKTSISALFGRGFPMTMVRLTDVPNRIITFPDLKGRNMIRNRLQLKIMLELEFPTTRGMMMKRLLKRMSLKRKMRIWLTTVTTL